MHFLAQTMIWSQDTQGGKCIVHYIIEETLIPYIIEELYIEECRKCNVHYIIEESLHMFLIGIPGHSGKGKDILS